jgi:GGDEF domain-containing protein
VIRKIEKMRFGNGLRLTSKVGIACQKTEPGMDIETMASRAEVALQRVKANKKDSVQFWTPDMS